MTTANVDPMLTDTRKAMLELEHSWWQYAGAKEAAIREQFDLTPVRYYQQLNTLIDQPAALAYDPITVKRLQRIRDRRNPNRARLASR